MALSCFVLPLTAAALLVQGGVEASTILPVGLALGLLVGLAFVAYQWGTLATRGTTLGKRLVGLRVDRVDGRPATFISHVLLREWVGTALLGNLMPGVYGAIDAISALSDDRRAVHDRLAGTRVVWANAPEAESD